MTLRIDTLGAHTGDAAHLPRLLDRGARIVVAAGRRNVRRAA